MGSTEKDVKIHKATAWGACNKLSRSLNQRLFAATMESVLLYVRLCEAWTVTPKLSKGLDGCYTRLLRAAFYVHWSQHMTNKQLYGDLPRITDKIRERRLRFAGHCCRSKEEPMSRILNSQLEP